MSPSVLRGTLGSLLGPGYASGFLLGHLISVGLSRICIGWRVSMGIQALFGLMYAIGMKWLPHTPRQVVGLVAGLNFSYIFWFLVNMGQCHDVILCQ